MAIPEYASLLIWIGALIVIHLAVGAWIRYTDGESSDEPETDGKDEA